MATPKAWRPAMCAKVGTKEAAAALITEHCGGNIEGRDGAYCVWLKPRAPKGTAFVISVVFKSQISHHLAVKEEDGSWTVNKKPTHPNVKNITSCIKFLGSKRKFWPVPLVDPVGANKDEDGNDDGNTKEPAKKEAVKKEPVKKDPAKKEAVKKEPVKEEPVEEEPAKDEDAHDGVYTVGGDGDGRATPSRLISKDDDGLPVNTRPATPGADEPVILDANGAPVVMPDKDVNVRRKFEGGDFVDVTLSRESMATSFGFQVYEAWLGVGKGHAIVVCEVFPGTPAMEKLKRRDILVEVNGTVIEWSSLENAKEILRELGTEADIKVYRRRDPAVFILDPVPLPTVTPLKRSEHEQMQRERTEGNDKKKKKGASVKVPASNPHRKVASIWDSEFDDGYGMTPKQQEREVKKMLREARKTNSLLDVTVTRHAILSPSPTDKRSQRSASNA